jgi:hypothetical protein
MFSHENHAKMMMGADAPIPPITMGAAAPGGAPPRRIKTVEIINCRFSWFGFERPFMCVSPEQKKILSGTGCQKDHNLYYSLQLHYP